MADDLGEEWWKADEDVLNTENDQTDKQSSSNQKKGVKRRKVSASESDKDTTPPQPKKTLQIKSNKKKKQLPEKKKHSRRKITEENDDKLLKSGLPADVMSLVESVTAKKKVADENVPQPIDPDLDFFPSNVNQLEGTAYLKEILPDWQKTMKKVELQPGSPLLLILSSSAIRAVQLNRHIKSFLGKDCKTAKLFAKHMKLEEQTRFLKKHVCHAGVGTPNRVQALLKAGCLKMDSVQAVVLDWNWRDVKLKRLVDIPDVRKDLVQLLRDFIIDTVHNTQCKIGLM
ncbi:protein CMSS1-like [Pomacea canaliculata]|nr:protein CMSS1-like [Pomacea canaliculata]